MRRVAEHLSSDTEAPLDTLGALESDRPQGQYGLGGRSRKRRWPVREDSRVFADGRDEGCRCRDDRCALRWGSIRGTTSLIRGRSTPGMSELSCLFGPLLTVKEYRDRRTGQVRFCIFQGNGTTCVAQILFTLKSNGHGLYGNITCVNVARDFRGKGLGALLFKEVFALFESLSVTEIRLEAEEEMCKYNRLVRYYEHLGFRQLEGSKVRYLHSNDQLFRKIPMYRQVRPNQPRWRRTPRLVGNGAFLVVRLQTRTGGVVRFTADGNVVSQAVSPVVSAGRGAHDGSPGGEEAEGCHEGEGGGAEPATARVTGGDEVKLSTTANGGKGATPGRDSSAEWRDRWILMQQGGGVVCFESAYGKYLCVEPDGKVVADRRWDSAWEQFRLERFADLRTWPSTSSCSTDEAPRTTNAAKNRKAASQTDSDLARAPKDEENRFALRTFHGQYLSLDAERGTVSASAQPVLWKTDARNAVCQCEGIVQWAGPPPVSKRQVALEGHLRRMRQTQDVSFVTRVRHKYLGSFGTRGRFSVKHVLDLLDGYHNPLASTWASRVSVAGLMVLTAEDIRDEGLPDWMQAVGLMHGLGCFLHFLGNASGVTPTEKECLLCEYSWVVGAPFPDSITCPSYNVDNADVLDERYGAGGKNPTGMYASGAGLDDALLCFTGPEYMYMLLKSNRIDIPPEGLAMLRYYPLEPWHAGNAYGALESSADRDVKDAVRQFDVIRRATLDGITYQAREANVQTSWEDHLGDLVDKFFPGELAW